MFMSDRNLRPIGRSDTNFQSDADRTRNRIGNWSDKDIFGSDRIGLVRTDSNFFTNCAPLLKDALTVAVTERVLERKKAPTIDTELAEIRNCHYLLRVAFDVDRIKDICRIRMVQLRYPHWNGKSREFRKLWERMEEGVKEFK